MAKTMDLREYLAELKTAKAEKRQAIENYNEAVARCREAFVPLEGDPKADDIRELYAMCPSDAPYHRSHILVALVLALYAPEALFGGRLPMRVAKAVSGAMGVKHETIYLSRNKVTAWLRLYPDFLRLVSELFATARQRKVCK